MINMVTIKVMVTPPVKDVVISYGSAIHDPLTTHTDISGIATFEWSLMKGQVYVNAQKTDWVFSYSVSMPTDVSWGESSDWIAVSPITRQRMLYGFPRSVIEVPVLPAVCGAWENIAEPVVSSTLSLEFGIGLSNAKWSCKDFTETKPINGLGKIKVGDVYIFDMPISNGNADFDLYGLLPTPPDIITSLSKYSGKNMPLTVMIPEEDGALRYYDYYIYVPPALFAVDIPIGIPDITPDIIPDVIPDVDEVCTEWSTRARANMPAVLSPRFPISISNAEWICDSTGAREDVTGNAKVIIGGYEFTIPIINGYGSPVDLGTSFDFIHILTDKGVNV